MSNKDKIKDSQVIYEDNHLIAINKSAGTIVQEDDTGDTPLDQLVKDYIAVKYNKPNGAFLGVVHRLDRPVSGLIVFAKTNKALDRMNVLFKGRTISKTYWAVVRKQPAKPHGTLKHWLFRDRSKNITRAYQKEVPGSKYAELSYEVLGSLDGYYLLRSE